MQTAVSFNGGGRFSYEYVAEKIRPPCAVFDQSFQTQKKKQPVAVILHRTEWINRQYARDFGKREVFYLTHWTPHCLPKRIMLMIQTTAMQSLE